MTTVGRASATGGLSRLYTWLAAAAGQGLLLGVGAVAFAVECLLLAATPPVTGFENYLVAAYPLGFWFAFAVVLIAALLVFVGATLSYSRNWRYALVLLAVNYGVFFFLPAHRGYALYDRGGSDALAHLGIARLILETDALPAVFYPAEHLLLSTLSMHGLSLPVSRYLFQFGFTLLFVGSVGVLVRELVGDERGLPAGLAAATPLVFVDFQVRIHPAIMAVMLFPLVMFLLERTRRADVASFRVVSVAVGLLVVFFHPVTTGFLAILVVSTLGFQRVYGYYRSETDPFAPDLGHVAVRTRLAGILLVTGFAWYVNFGRTQDAVGQLLGTLLDRSTESGEPTIVASQARLAQEASLSLFEILVRFVQKYGSTTLYFAVAGVFGLAVLDRIRRRSTEYTGVYVATQAAIGVAITLVFLNVNLIESDPVRVSRYAIVMSVVAVGVVFYRAASGTDGHGRRGLLVVVTVVAVVAAALGTFAGTTYWPNKQMTHAEYGGAEFTLAQHDPDDRVRTASLTVKTQWYITGQRSREGEPPVFQSGEGGYDLPPDLGYDENRRAADTFADGDYLVTHAYDLEFDEANYYTPEQRRTLGVYEPRHVERLDSDATVNKVYANGGFALWKVTADTSPEGDG
jgi:hypothetical protein